MKLHHYIALPFMLLALLFGYIAYQISSDYGQSFDDFWDQIL